MNNKIIGLSILVLIIIVYLKRKKIMSLYNDLISLQRVDQLHPSIRKDVKRFLEIAKQGGINLRVTSTHRDFDEQNALYAKGRTQPGKIVTNAKGGESKHNFRVAFDVVIMDNGNPVWEYNDPRWDEIGDLGKRFGFIWGGDFKSIKDKPHFELPISLSKLQALYKQKGDNKYINLA